MLGASTAALSSMMTSPASIVLEYGHGLAHVGKAHASVRAVGLKGLSLQILKKIFD